MQQVLDVSNAFALVDQGVIGIITLSAKTVVIDTATIEQFCVQSSECMYKIHSG